MKPPRSGCQPYLATLSLPASRTTSSRQGESRIAYRPSAFISVLYGSGNMATTQSVGVQGNGRPRRLPSASTMTCSHLPCLGRMPSTARRSSARSPARHVRSWWSRRQRGMARPRCWRRWRLDTRPMAWIRCTDRGRDARSVLARIHAALERCLDLGARHPALLIVDDAHLIEGERALHALLAVPDDLLRDPR